MQCDVQQAAMSTELNLGQSADRFLVELTLCDESQSSGPLRNKNVAVGKKDHAPWAVQTFYDRDDPNLLRIGFKLQTLDLVLSGTGGQHHDKCREKEEETNELSNRLHASRAT